MRLNDFERILAEKILEDLNWKEPVLDQKALKAEQIETYLTARLKSWQFKSDKKKTSHYQRFNDSFDPSSKQTQKKENQSFETENTNKTNDKITFEAPETRVQTENLDLVDRIYIQKLIEMGAPERLYFSFTAAELKKSYRRLAFTYHPDQGGSQQAFTFLVEAFAALENQFK